LRFISPHFQVIVFLPQDALSPPPGPSSWEVMFLVFFFPPYPILLTVRARSSPLNCYPPTLQYISITFFVSGRMDPDFYDVACHSEFTRSDDLYQTKDPVPFVPRLVLRREFVEWKSICPLEMLRPVPVTCPVFGEFCLPIFHLVVFVHP